MDADNQEPLPAGDPPDAAPKPKPYSEKLFDALQAKSEDDLKAVIVGRIHELIASHNVGAYNVVIFFDDERSISDFHADRIYNDVSRVEPARDILLLVQSRGGRVEPAYLISRTCKKISPNKFVVAVPRRAKSAATLLSLGADELHLGMMSQLGPIDPQVGDLPALGLANGLSKITALVCDYPKSSEMWAKYLSENLSLRHLGYFERISESAAQYAERLLRGKQLPDGTTGEQLANHFVNHYKDHSFLIDVDEALALLGPEVVKTGTPEYDFANQVYKDFAFAELLAGIFIKKNLTFVGDLTPGSISLHDKVD